MKQSQLYKIFKKIFFTVLFAVYNYFPANTRNYNFAKWVKDNGDKKHFVNFPINSDSLVIDVGGYTGHFADEIINLYDPRIHIYEPVKAYFKFLKQKYRKNKKVRVYNAALSNYRGTGCISILKDGTSLQKNSGMKENIVVEDVASVVGKFKKANIDLVSINIEGSEYALLNRLIEKKLLDRIRFIQVQFHDFVPNAEVIRKKILRQIRKTHTKKYSYPFVWEAFEIKKSLLLKK